MSNINGRYKGEWINDEITGKGELEYINGDNFSGEFKENKREGKGRY